MPYSEQTVQSTHNWSDRTFSFKTTRPFDFTFKNGEFVSIGIRPEGKLIARAYSIVSTNQDDYLEFLSIHVPNGPLTSHLANIHEGESVWINKKSTGTLTMQHVMAGRNLYMLATGTGLAPFISLIHDNELFKRFDNVVLVHSVRNIAELAYKKEIESLANLQLHYVPTVTREPFTNRTRGADLFRSGELFRLLGFPVADPEHDRVMICGNPDMNKEMTTYLKQHGWTETNHAGVGNFTKEKAFAIR